jgi:dTDP-4-amino-4,6-dideoxygalactose transaminase
MQKHNVPFADLHAQYLTIKPEIDAAIADVIRTSSFIRGPYVERFEQDFADAIGVKRCVSLPTEQIRSISRCTLRGRAMK